MTSQRWLIVALGVGMAGFTLSVPSVGARCIDDMPIMTHGQTAPSAGSCGERSCAGGGAAQTRYGISSYASASASWSCLDPHGVYHDLQNGHGCGGAFDDCYRGDGCSGSCYGYWSSTQSWIRGSMDADAGVMA